MRMYPIQYQYVPNQASKTDFDITLLPKDTKVKFQCRNSSVSGDDWQESNEGTAMFPLKEIREGDVFEVNFIVEQGQAFIPPLAFSFIPNYDVTLSPGTKAEPSSNEEELGEKPTESVHECDPSYETRVNLTIGPPSISFLPAGLGGTGYLRCVFDAQSPYRLTYWNWRIHGTSAWCPPPPAMPAPKVNDAKVAQAASGSGIDYNLKFIPTVSGDTAPNIFTVRVYANYTTMIKIKYQEKIE